MSTSQISSKSQTGIVPAVVYRLGFWSALLSTVFAIAFSMAAIADRFGLPPPPWRLIPLMAPSLLLALSFVVLMVCIHYYAPEGRKVWSHIGLVFAIIYAVLISIVYFVELTVVLPHLLQDQGEKVAVLLFTSFDSFMYALDVLGYGFMSLATLFTAWVFSGDNLERSIRWALFANGVLVLVIPTQMLLPPLLYVAALWMVTFPLSTILLAVLFNRTKKRNL